MSGLNNRIATKAERSQCAKYDNVDSEVAEGFFVRETTPNRDETFPVLFLYPHLQIRINDTLMKLNLLDY